MNAIVQAKAFARYEEADVSLLAKTPAFIKPDDRVNLRWELFRNQLENRLYALRNWRLGWWSHWARLAEALLPRRYHWLITPNTFSRGQPINQAIINPTGTQAVRVCTAGMRSGLMSSSRPWFKLKSAIDGYPVDQEGQGWFDEVEARMYAVLAGSNFYATGTQMFEDSIVFGTAPVLIYEDKQDIIRCQNPTAGEYYLGNGPDNRVNSFYRTFNMTLIQIVQMFGLRNCGPEIQALWVNKSQSLDIEFTVAHAIEPNIPLEMPGMPPNLGVVPGGFPFREVFWLWGKATPEPLSVKGFRSVPFIVNRWATTSNDPYGRSCGMDALPDILQLHQMGRRQAEALEKLLRPPMIASVDMKNQPSSILPGRVTYAKDIERQGMKPMYQINPDLSHWNAMEERIEKRIHRWFFNDLFQMLERMEGVQPRNELEINERRGEKLQVLGPVVENAEQDLAGALQRTFQIMQRRGLIPPKPHSLGGTPLGIEILSMIALAQRAAETSVMERVVTVAAQASQTFPEEPPIDFIDPNKFIKRYADRVSFPMSIMNSDDYVKRKREMRAKQQAAAAQKMEEASAVTHMAPAAAKAARDASQTDLGGGLNAVSMLAGAPAI